MSSGLNDIISCFCRNSSDDCHDHKDCNGKKDNNIFMWILIIAVIFCCNGSNGIFSGNACGSCDTKKNNNLWIILVIIFICIFCKDGFQGVGGLLGTPSGNLNTNIINLDREDYCDDYC